jgi:hypothetical protein
LNNKLSFLADSLIIEALAKDDTKIAIAQDGGVLSSIVNNIKSYVMNEFDKDHPAASILSLIGPGIMWKLGFPWLSGVMALAGILGFDWTGFWSNLGQDVVKIVDELRGQKENPPTEGQISSQVNGAVQNAFEQHFTGQVDQSKLEQAAKSNLGTSSSAIQDSLDIKKFAIEFANNPTFIKEAASVGLLKGKLSKFFIRTIGWAVSAAIMSLPFIAAMGIGKGLLGGSSSNTQETQKSNTDLSEKLPMSPNVSSDLLATHRNDISSVWIERGDIANISDMLVDWIEEAYPQFSKHRDQLTSSSSFQRIKDAFRARNRLATGTGLISIPQPYQRKVDVVKDIINGFLAEKHIVNA